MPGSSHSFLWRRKTPQGFLFSAGILSALLFASASRSDQPAAEVVGAVEGADIIIKGPISVEIADGLSRMVVSSGSEVTVKSGQARIDLAEGGEIGICGPAHVSLLKSPGALTVALDYGSLHARIGFHPALTIYTPLIVARPVEIGGGQSETLVGLKPDGTMCVRATQGAARIEQQLTGQSLIVPPGGEASLAEGLLKSLPAGETGCGCEILAAKADPPALTERKEVSALGSAKDVRPNLPSPRLVHTGEEGDGNGKLPSPPAVEEPVYKVFMPPLLFDASSPAPPADPSPETILLVRTVRVRSSVVFRGHISPGREMATPISLKAAPQTTAASPPPAPKTPQQKPSMAAKMKAFLHRLWN